MNPEPFVEAYGIGGQRRLPGKTRASLRVPGYVGRGPCLPSHRTDVGLPEA
jgi:hypothetical protein